MKNKKIFMLILFSLLTFILIGCNKEKPKEVIVDPKVNQTESEKEKTEEFDAIEKGYGGDVKVKLVVENNEIKDIVVKADAETPTIGGSAIEELVKKMKETNSIDVQAVSGATISSNAFKKAVEKALESKGIKPTDLKAKSAASTKIDLNQEADVVVVGAGGAGLSAAIKSAESGKSVIIVEKAANAGGNTNRATGGMNAAETHYQKEQNIPDTVDQFIKDTMKGGHDVNNPELVKVMAENSSKAIDWLDSMDAKLSDVGLAGGASFKRQHRPVDENGKIIKVGSFIVEKLSKKASELGIKTIYNARVNEILMDGDKVSGVKAQTGDGDLTIKSKAVIVATGGFGNNNDLVAKYRPELKGYVSTNAPTIEGDAISFLDKIGANFVDMKEIQIHPTVAQKDGSLVSESLRGDGAILLNKEGKRFVDEMQTRDYVSNAINEQTEKTAWIIVDQKMYDESKVVQGYVSRELLTKVDDISKLAEFIGADKAQVEKTINDWTSYVKDGVDKDFNHKNLSAVRSDLSNAPYYVGAIAPGIHHTMGGVEINTTAQVINKDKQAIKGLYAAGEVVGGVHGANRLGGNAVTDIVVFGIIAGENAAKYVEGN